MLSALLDAGANINAANLTSFTPLYHAAEAGSKDAAVLLIARGLIPRSETDTNRPGSKPLCHPAVAQILDDAATNTR
jgi:ankyrin repeat protein